MTSGEEIEQRKPAVEVDGLHVTEIKRVAAGIWHQQVRSPVAGGPANYMVDSTSWTKKKGRESAGYCLLGGSSERQIGRSQRKK